MKKNDKIILISTAFFACLGMVVNGIKQREKIKQNPNERFELDELLATGLLWGLCGGVGSALFLFLISRMKKDKFDEEDFNEVIYLSNALSTYEMDEVDKKTMSKGLEIRGLLYNDFGNLLLGKPSYQGSIPLGTSLSGLSDLDIRVGFKKTSFPTLEQMYLTILEYFEKEYDDPDLIEVRPQKRSIGLVYNIEGYEVCIDVVPGRRTNFNKGGNEYNLFENSDGYFDKPSRVKMNPHTQAYLGRNSSSVSKIIALLKVLNTSEDLSMKSVLIKELTIYAFDHHRGNLPRKMDKQLLMVMEYIRDNIESKTIFAPDNKNIILSDCLSAYQKTQIADALDVTIQDIQENPVKMREYFPTKEILLGF